MSNKMMLENVAIISAVRTPIGKGLKGVFRTTRPDDLAGFALKESVARAKVDPNLIEDVIVGCAMPEAEQGMNVARTISFRAGLGNGVSAATINRFCSSGLHAVADIAKSIATGQIKVGIGAGVESMSMVPMGGNKPSANPYLMENFPECYTSMGITAENVATQFNVDRKTQDEFALSSHKKACEAIAQGYFKDEIVPITSSEGILIEKDEGPRADTNLDALGSLKPAFKLNGTVTAGNSSQISDGAASVLLMDSKFAQEKSIPIKGYFRAFVTAGVAPGIMGVGPVYAVRKLLDKTGLSLKDIGVFEINEAFAAQAVYCVQELEIDQAKVNPLGGAIALGHPLGCTGARQIATILSYMHKKSLRFGICTMCVGGGMGAAGLIELA